MSSYYLCCTRLLAIKHILQLSTRFLSYVVGRLEMGKNRPPYVSGYMVKLIYDCSLGLMDESMRGKFQRSRSTAAK